MKNIITSLFIVICSQVTFSQFSSIFGSSSTSWNMLVKEHNIPRVDSLVVCCDTIINSKTYKALDAYSIRNSSSTLFYPKQHFIREDTSTGKVVYRLQAKTIENTLNFEQPLNISKLNLKNRVYVIKVENEKHSLSEKIIIQ